MPIEAGTNIVDLDKLWPLSGDDILEGDNHLRLLKEVLKAQFPGVGGQGFAEPIVASEQELNWLVGLTGNIQEQLNAITVDYKSELNAPQGTTLILFQVSAPVGWTQLAANDDSMLRVVSGVGGGVAGTDSPISFDWTHVHTTGSLALSTAQMPAHNHQHGYDSKGNSGSQQSGSVKYGSVGDTGNASAIAWCTTNTKGSGSSHNHGNTSSQGFSFTPRYIDVITVVKD